LTFSSLPRILRTFQAELFLPETALFFWRKLLSTENLQADELGIKANRAISFPENGPIVQLTNPKERQYLSSNNHLHRKNRSIRR
ncbi:MAG: hypothetical protein AAF985_21865, partial [Bacteroidota bacterium]